MSINLSVVHTPQLYTPCQISTHTLCYVTPRSQGCVAASYVCLLLTILRVILYTWKMHLLAFCGSQICKKMPRPRWGSLQGSPARSWWGGACCPILKNPTPSRPFWPRRVRPLSQVHTLPWGKFIIFVL